ncbi:MAG: hypothetical protein KA586_07225 [Candidatus Promineofilum sp.]|nr:hypothetical protein [Promineifilum sp.]
MDDSWPIPLPHEQVIAAGDLIAIDEMHPAAAIDRAAASDNVSPFDGAPSMLPALRPDAEASPTAPADPEFDAYMTVIKLLIGGTIEGAAELSKRLERWESELRAADGALEAGQIHSDGDAARYLLAGMVLSAGDGARRQVVRLAQASDMLFRITGNAAQPFVNNRLTGIVTRPFDRTFNRLVNRGQQRINDWIELGRTQEPGARRIARKTYKELVDELIGNLAENRELADLVQKKSVGLASEAVDEFRSRTVSADAMAENIVRRILRRPPRSELPEPSEDIRQAVAADTLHSA